jgi:hypothetical protein
LCSSYNTQTHHMVGSDCNKIFKRAYISGSHYPSVWYPSAKQKSPFLHFFFYKSLLGRDLVRNPRNNSSKEEEEEIEIPKSWLQPEIRYSQRNWKFMAALPCPCPALSLPCSPCPALPLPCKTDRQTDTMFALIYKISWTWKNTC